MAIKQKFARKAVKTTAKHSAHGAVSKLKRDPARATALLGAGLLIGALVGWVVARIVSDDPVVSEDSGRD
ncbi:MAG TPA: hypothetical protein VMS11_10960 [Solirubrobacterales bacterium]|nr:hypothetical protein [Solirubrobacterales bacterium]